MDLSRDVIAGKTILSSLRTPYVVDRSDSTDRSAEIPPVTPPLGDEASVIETPALLLSADFSRTRSVAPSTNTEVNGRVMTSDKPLSSSRGALALSPAKLTTRSRSASWISQRKSLN